jgi:hypothetical protein
MDSLHTVDAWEIDPITATIMPTETVYDPVVLIVEPSPGLSRAIGEVCDFLRVRIECISNARETGYALREIRPMAVFTQATTVDCGVYDLLMAVADYDHGLPVMVVTDADPAARGALEGAQKLWQLTELQSVSKRPGIRSLIDFLFTAGRRNGAARMMPV